MSTDLSTAFWRAYDRHLPLELVKLMRALDTSRPGWKYQGVYDNASASAKEAARTGLNLTAEDVRLMPPR